MPVLVSPVNVMLVVASAPRGWAKVPVRVPPASLRYRVSGSLGKY